MFSWNVLLEPYLYRLVDIFPFSPWLMKRAIHHTGCSYHSRFLFSFNQFSFSWKFNSRAIHICLTRARSPLATVNHRTSLWISRWHRSAWPRQLSWDRCCHSFGQVKPRSVGEVSLKVAFVTAVNWRICPKWPTRSKHSPRQLPTLWILFARTGYSQ